MIIKSPHHQIIKFLFLIIFLPLLSFSQQAPAYDECINAREVRPGDHLFSLSNATCSTTHGEIPDGVPITCVKTFENDVWFKFEGDSAYDYYTILIKPRSCATPAGLQAMIIQSDFCDATDFEYKACANPYGEEELKFHLHDPIHGQNYFIYVDGYDGNICIYDLEFKGHRDNPLVKADYLRLQNDYDTPKPPFFEPDIVDIAFRNNEVHLEWKVNSRDPIELFLVERIRDGRSPYGVVMASIEPQNAVVDKLATYQFTDVSPVFADGQLYCYRIVKIGIDGTKTVTEPICITADVIKSFSVTRVFPIPDTKTYTILFTNRKKQDLAFKVLDANKEELKGMVLSKEPKRSSQVELDMESYEPGVYYLKVEGKDEFYLREFVLP